MFQQIPLGRSLGFSTPSQPFWLYHGEDTIRLIARQSLFAVPDILQSLFGEVLEKIQLHETEM